MVAEDIFRIQQEIATGVAQSLKNEFIPGNTRPTDDEDAWLDYLSGLNFYWKNESYEDFSNAIAYFEKAVESDPDFVEAYVKLASAHAWVYHFFYDRTPGRLENVLGTISSAKEIDPGNKDILLAEAIYYYLFSIGIGDIKRNCIIVI